MLRVSGLIEELQRIQAEYGDLPIMFFDTEFGSAYEATTVLVREQTSKDYSTSAYHPGALIAVLTGD